MAQHYDVIVIGMQASGLVTASLLAKRGRRVLLVDHGENTTYYQRGGYKLPLLPVLLPALEDSPPVRAVHDELGLAPELRAKGTMLEPAFQAVMPDHRVDLHASPERLSGEIGAEFPEVADAVKHFFERLFALDQEMTDFLARTPPLPPSGWRERWRTRKLLSAVKHLEAPFEQHDLFAGIPEDHPVRELLLGPLTFFGHLGTDSPSTFHAARLIARYYRGTLAFSDRLGSLQGLLAKAAETAGVEVRRGAVVKHVELAGKRIVHLTLEDDRHDYSADFFVNNALSPFEELVPPGKHQARYTMERGGLRPVGSLMVINLVVDCDVVPCGMAEALFVLNGRRKARGDEPVDPPLFLRRYPATRGEAAKPGKEAAEETREVLSVACPVRTLDVARSPERLSALRAQMIGRVARVVPFLSEFLRDSSLTADTGSWDVDAEGVRRKIDPWALHPIYETTEPPLLGVAARRNRGYFKNLVHCTRDVVPGLGIEGEYIAGIAAADTLVHLAGKKWQARR